MFVSIVGLSIATVGKEFNELDVTGTDKGPQTYRWEDADCSSGEGIRLLVSCWQALDRWEDGLAHVKGYYRETTVLPTPSVQASVEDEGRGSSDTVGTETGQGTSGVEEVDESQVVEVLPTRVAIPTAVPTRQPTAVPTRVPVQPTKVPAPPPVVPVDSNDMVAVICSMPWPCQEALFVVSHEGGLRWVYNYAGSGACGPFQLLPCQGWQNIVVHVQGAYVKWLDGGGSFCKHWYKFWSPPRC